MTITGKCKAEKQEDNLFLYQIWLLKMLEDIKNPYKNTVKD